MKPLVFLVRCHLNHIFIKTNKKNQQENPTVYWLRYCTIIIAYWLHRQWYINKHPLFYSMLHLPVYKCLHNIAIAGLKILHREEIPNPNDWTNSSSETSHITQNNCEHLMKQRHPWACKRREYCWRIFYRWHTKGKAAFAGVMITGKNNSIWSY